MSEYGPRETELRNSSRLTNWAVTKEAGEVREAVKERREVKRATRDLEMREQKRELDAILSELAQRLRVSS